MPVSIWLVVKAFRWWLFIWAIWDHPVFGLVLMLMCALAFVDTVLTLSNASTS